MELPGHLPNFFVKQTLHERVNVLIRLVGVVALREASGDAV